MTTTPPTQHRSGLIVRVLQKLLGLDELAAALQGRDLAINSATSKAQATADGALEIMRKVVDQLNETTRMAQVGISASDRLTWYETRVPQISGAKKAYDIALKERMAKDRAERSRRVSLIAQHPELSDEGRRHVMQTGELPELAAGPVVEDGAA